MEQIGTPTHEAHIHIDAPPERVWAIVSDVTRIPEWSPVCHTVSWIDGSTGLEVGARFRGTNKLNGVSWSRDCEVTEVEPGSAFAFSTRFKGEESTRWRYRVRPSGTGSSLSEAYEVVMMPAWVRLLRAIPGAKAKSERDTRANLDTSLQRLKAIAEGT